MKLAKCHDIFNKKVSFGRTPTSTSVFKSFAETLKNWATMNKESCKMVEKHLIKQTNYTCLEIDAHNDVITLNRYIFLVYILLLLANFIANKIEKPMWE